MTRIRSSNDPLDPPDRKGMATEREHEEGDSMMFRVILVSGLFLSAILTAGAMQADDDPEQLYNEGRKAFRGCAACHFVNEPTMQEDEHWLLLNNVTGCIQAGDETPRVRKALDVYLRAEKTRRPLFVDENYVPREGRVCGKLKVPATSGTAFLKTERESIRSGAPPKVRLYWKATSAGQTLTVPAGKYRIIGYRFFRTVEDNREALWTLSVTDINGCADIEVTEGGVASLDFLPEMRGTLSAESTEEGIKFSLAIRNEKDSTLTLSKDGNMCLPRFVIEDPAGKKVFDDVFENT